MLDRLSRFYHEHEPACTAGLFVAGFLFDTLAVGRIDSLHNVIHQATYLALCAAFIGLELRERHGGFTPPPRLQTAWKYQAGATHFMLGTLLNIYTLFYFKSASLAASFLFLCLLAALLAVNELRPFAGSAASMRMALFALCLASYFTYLVPMLLGAIGPWPFALSMLCAGAVGAGLAKLLGRRMPESAASLRREVARPFGGVLLAFSLLYALKAIPPVPLSLSYIGVYHDVRRDDGKWVLVSQRPRWRFWERGDQTFEARPGDRIHCFVSVFSPTHFRETLRLRWQFDDPLEGWKESDAIPLEIAGGRDEGYRGSTVKARYKPGRWRVRVETSDGRELGRIDVKVVEASGPAPKARVLLR